MIRLFTRPLMLGALVLAGCIVDISGAPCLANENCAPGQICVREVGEPKGICRFDALDGSVGGGAGGGQADSGADAGRADAGSQDAGVPCDGGCGSFAPYCDCLLAELRPSTAGLGQTVYFEGRFGSSVSVQFPGLVTLPATLSSPTRASVVVPAGATAGALSVVSGGQVLGPIAFRSASFPLHLGRFDPHYDQPGYARPMPALLTPRAGLTATVVGPWVYVIGGVTVERALINADGTLSSFKVYPSSLIFARTGHSTTLIGSRLYVIGGANLAGSLLDSVEYAEVGADGSLSPFDSIPGVSLVTRRIKHTSVVIGDGLYVIGGTMNGSGLRTIDRATILPNGLSNFAEVRDVTLSTGRYSHALAVAGDSVFVIGGAADGSELALSTLERAHIEPGGLTTFTPVTSTSLLAARLGASAVVLQNRLFVIGGKNLSGMLSTVESSIVTPSDGTLSNFGLDPVSTLAAGRAHAATVIVGNYLYAVGGTRGAGSGSPLNSLERASINGSGAIANPQAVPSPFLSSRLSADPVVVGNTVYFIGGNAAGAAGTIERATFAPDGTLSAFAYDSRDSGAQRILNARLAVVGDFIYVVGGNRPANPDAGISATNDLVIRSELLTDGGLGPFATVATLSAQRNYATLAAFGNTLYVIGGRANGATTALQTWEKVLLSTDGGVQVVAGNFNLPQVRSHHVSVVGRNGIFLIGGSQTTNVSGTVDRVSVDLDGNLLGSQFTNSSLDIFRSSSTLSVVGDSVYVMGGNTVALPSPNDTMGRARLVRDGGAEGELSSFAGQSSPLLPLMVQPPYNSAIVVGNHMYYFYSDSPYMFTLQ